MANKHTWGSGDPDTASTVLVLGAGSNVEFGFPSGMGLTKKIVADLAPAGSDMQEYLRNSHNVDELREFRLEFIKSQCQSIDSFLQYRQEFASIGRRAIAFAILEYERLSGADDFGDGKIPKIFRYENNWYRYLLDNLGDSPDQVASKRVRIVTFNYDRSLERYLMTAAMSRYKLSTSDAANMIAPLGLKHVYGSVGSLLPAADEIVVDYGALVRSSSNLDKVAERIRVVDGRDDDSIEFGAVRAWLSTAAQIVFLGFGYDSVNLRRLLSFPSDGTQSVTGTAHGFTTREVQLAQWEIQEHISTNSCNLHNEDGSSKVEEFLREMGTLRRRWYTPMSPSSSRSAGAP